MSAPPSSPLPNSMYSPPSSHANITPAASSPIPNNSPPLSPSDLHSIACTLTRLAESKAHLLKLDWWREDEKALQKSIELKEAYRSRCHTEIHNLFGIYLVFQGVVFTAVAQSTILSCKDWWSPFFLSLIASLATILAIWHKLAASVKVGEELKRDRRRSEAVYHMIEEIQRYGAEFDLRREPQVDLPDRVELKFCQFVSIYGAAVTATLVTFSAFVLVSCVKVLCRNCKCPS